MSRSTRSRGLLGVTLAAVLAASACGEDAPGPVGPTQYRWTLQVRVLSEQAQPVAGATVRILDGPNVGLVAVTDSSGAATFSQLLQSGFTVDVSAPGYLPAQSAVTLTSSITVSVTLQQRPVNAPPVIAGIVARGSRPDEPIDFADAGESILIAAAVTDAETPVDQLAFEWTADGGTLSGGGPTVTWTAPATGPAPKDYTITLTVVETVADSVLATAGAGGESPAGTGGRPSGPAALADNRVTATTTVRVHESAKEVGDLAWTFLTDFSNSSVSPENAVRNFTETKGCGRADELKDITDNRATRVINSYRLGTPWVNVAFGAGCAFRNRPGDACIEIACEWNSTIKATGKTERSWGTCKLTAVYEQRAWWMCWSEFDGQTSTGLRFMR